jgi:hypothetical protein
MKTVDRVVWGDEDKRLVLLFDKRSMNPELILEINFKDAMGYDAWRKYDGNGVMTDAMLDMIAWIDNMGYNEPVPRGCFEGQLTIHKNKRAQRDALNEEATARTVARTNSGWPKKT